MDAGDARGRAPDRRRAPPTPLPAGAHRLRRAARRQRAARRAGRDPRPTIRLLALFVGLDRQAQGHGAHPRQPVLDRRAVRQAGARPDRGRRLLLGRQAVLRLRPRQCADAFRWRRRDRRADGRAADARCGLQALDRRREARDARPSFFGAPTGFAGMLASPDLPAREAVALRLCSSAGEALPREIGERFKAHFGCDIVDGIGSTEMLHIFLSNRPGDVRYGTTGRPVPGYEIELRGEDGRPVADGEIGDLYIRGPSAALMYWGNREKSRETFQGGWTKSGDKYSRDADGYYTYAGRSDDMLKVSGIYVSPFEVEATLMQHPAVLECAVIGTEDAEGLTKTKAFVVLKPGQAVSDGGAKAFVKERLAPYKYPRFIEFVDELPKTATGKIQRFRLRERERERVTRGRRDAARVASVAPGLARARARLEYEWVGAPALAARRWSSSCTKASARSRCGRTSRAAVRAARPARPRVLALRLRPLDAASRRDERWDARLHAPPGARGAAGLLRRASASTGPGCSATATAARSRCCMPRVIRRGRRGRARAAHSSSRTSRSTSIEKARDGLRRHRPAAAPGALPRRPRLGLLRLERRLAASARSATGTSKPRSTRSPARCSRCRARTTSTARWSRSAASRADCRKPACS